MTTKKTKKPRKQTRLTLEQLLNAEPYIMEALVRIYSALEMMADKFDNLRILSDVSDQLQMMREDTGRSMQEALYVRLLGNVTITGTERSPQELEELAKRARVIALGWTSYYFNPPPAP